MGPAAEIQASAAACAVRRKEVCVALKGVAAVYGGTGPFNRVIHLVLSL